MGVVYRERVFAIQGEKMEGNQSHLCLLDEILAAKLSQLSIISRKAYKVQR